MTVALVGSVSLVGCFSADGPRNTGVGNIGDGSSGGGEVQCPPVGEVGPLEGSLVAPVVLDDGAGESHALYDRCGEVTLVGIGAGWCVACREEMPEFEEWYAELGPQGLSIYYVLFQDRSSDPASRTTARDWADEHGTSFPVVYDPLDSVRDKHVDAADLEVPVAILLDRSLHIRYILGNPPVSQVKAKIQELLAE